MKWIYTSMMRPIMSYACMSWAGGLKQVSSEETCKSAKTCLPNDFISFSWHPYWCSGNTVNMTPMEEFLLAGAVRWTYRITVSGSGMSTALVPLGKRKTMLMFAMRLEDS